MVMKYKVFSHRFDDVESKFGNLVIKSDVEVENFRQRIYNKVKTVSNYKWIKHNSRDISFSPFSVKKEKYVWGIGIPSCKRRFLWTKEIRRDWASC